MVSVSVVIPVYRAERTLPELYLQLVRAMERDASAFEIIFIEDGGGDGSWPVISALARDDPRVRGIRMGRNFGQHNALLCGIRAAIYEVIVTMDDDLQHPVGEIASLLAALTPNWDVVYGVAQKRRHGLWRDGAALLMKFALVRATGSKTVQDISAFRAFRTRLRDGFRDFRGPFVSIDVLLTWSSDRFRAIRLPHAPRVIGKSGYGLGKLIGVTLDILTGFNNFPLRAAMVFGALLLVLGVTVAIFAPSNPDRSSSAILLAALIASFSGSQLLAAGVLGEYFGRVHQQIIGRPAYVVSEDTGGKNNEQADRST